MKQVLAIILTFAYFLFSPVILPGQGLPNISGVEVIPSQPLSTDQIKIVGHAIYPYCCNVMDSDQVYIDTVNKHIQLRHDQCYGNLAVLWPDSDTFDLGMLPVGLYTVEMSYYAAWSSLTTGDCSNVLVIQPSDTYNFHLWVGNHYSSVIDSLVIQPDSPGVNDDVSVIMYTSHLTSNAVEDSFQVDIDLSNQTIDIQFSQCNGTFQAIYDKADTIQLGSLPAGDYELTMNLFSITPDINGDCIHDLSVTPDDVEVEPLAVKAATSISIPEPQLRRSNIFPNPANKQLRLQTNLAGEKSIVIYDLLGQHVYANSMEENECFIDIASLDVGIYHISIAGSSGIVDVLRFVKM